MKKHTWDWLLILHVLLILWALLYFLTLFQALSWGIVAGLFLSIPLSIVSLIGRAKGRFSPKASILVVPLSALTFLAGAATWALLFMAHVLFS